MMLIGVDLTNFKKHYLLILISQYKVHFQVDKKKKKAFFYFNFLHGLGIHFIDTYKRILKSSQSDQGKYN